MNPDAASAFLIWIVYIFNNTPPHSVICGKISFCHNFPSFLIFIRLTGGAIWIINIHQSKESVMIDLSKLSSRAELAYNVLKSGGSYVNRLETNSYTGREQFHYRLENSDGWIMKGFGGKTFYELCGLNLLTPAYSTSVSSYYKLRA
jgi:hypothetical protein